MTSKKISPQSITGEKGVNLVQQIVLAMKFAWRPTPVFDAGIDGEIEICDPVTGEATNTVIKVQIKATGLPFQGETSDSFEYTCEQRDLAYWLRGNATVILIVCRPDTNEAYWVPVKDYFKELAAQKTCKVRFDKRHDRFDPSCAPMLVQLALPKDSGIYFSPLPKTETLFSNLLKVTSFAPKIYVAETNYRDTKAVWAKFRSMGVKAGSEWMLSNQRILSFHNLEEYPFNTICDLGTCEDLDASEWSETDDEDKKRDFVRLLNMCLRERTRLLGLRFHKEYGYYYFTPMPRLRTRTIEYQSIKQRASREVFKKYGKKSDLKETAYCRHSAFKGYFVRLAGEWYLEITPTYHFTFDGYREDRFREEHLKGIKRLERNPAVFGLLLMWVDFLRKPMQNMFSSEYPFLSFGELATVDINISIPDDVWYMAEEGGEADSLIASENQPTLWGL